MAKQVDPSSITLPIPSASLTFAQTVSAPYADDAIAQRIFGNAIAVATLHNFFEMLGIPSTYKDSELYHPAVQIAADLADLELSGIGLLECRWIESEAATVSVPMEGQGDRVGYAFVSFELEDRQATIHGFVPRANIDPFPQDELRSVEFMLQYLQALAVPQISLTRWLSGLFEPGWEQVESLIHPQTLCPSFRAVETPSPYPVMTPPSNHTHGGRVCRAKQLSWRSRDESDLETQPSSEPMVLVMDVSQTAPLVTRVSVQVHSTECGKCLPVGLALSILNEGLERLMHATTRPLDNYLQLHFKGEPGEVFQVHISLGSHSVIETFQL